MQVIVPHLCIFLLKAEISEHTGLEMCLFQPVPHFSCSFSCPEFFIDKKIRSFSVITSYFMKIMYIFPELVIGHFSVISLVIIFTVINHMLSVGPFIDITI